MAFQDKASKKYLFIAGALATAVVSIGGYYLYKAFTYDLLGALIDASMTTSIDELKAEIRSFLLVGDSHSDKGGEIAFRISNEINKLAQRFYDLNYKSKDEMRRKAIDNAEQYKQLCHETLSLKEECVTKASKKVLELLEDMIDLEKIENWITMIEPSKLEEYTKRYIHVSQKEEPLPSIALLKEAYKFYANLLYEEHQLLSQASSTEEPKADDLIFYSMVIKLKVDDKIFINYNLTEESMRNGLKELNLLNDPDILDIQNQLKKLMPMVLT